MRGDLHAALYAMAAAVFACRAFDRPDSSATDTSQCNSMTTQIELRQLAGKGDLAGLKAGLEKRLLAEKRASGSKRSFNHNIIEYYYI